MSLEDWMMMTRRGMIIGGGAAAVLGSSASPSWSLPLEISPADLVFVSLALEKLTVRALVDTGSVRSLQISQPVASRLGLKLDETGAQTQRYQNGGRKVLAGTLHAARLAELRLADVAVSVAPGDIEAISAQIGESFDAIVGWPLLSQKPFVIDYPARTFEFVDADLSGSLHLKLASGKALPVVAGTIGDQSETFLIDTGAPLNSVDPAVAGVPAGQRVPLAFSIGGKHFTETFRVKDLSAMTRGLGARAVIGHSFLRQYRFSWRPSEQSIGLAPAEARPSGGVI